MAKLDIKSVETLGRFENIVSASPKEIQDVARALRALIADVYPGVTEVPWGVQKNIGYGIGPRKQSEHFCYIFPHAHHVNLGFMHVAVGPSRGCNRHPGVRVSAAWQRDQPHRSSLAKRLVANGRAA